MIKKVLIVDDDAIVLFMHDLVVKNSGLANETIQFSNGKEALQYLNENGPFHYYIILLDLNMPVMNGWQLLTALNKTSYRDRLDVTIVSSSIDPYDIRKSEMFPMVKRYLSKPLSLEHCLALKQDL